MSDLISVEAAKKLARDDIARLIDYTSLGPDVTGVQIEILCEEALKYNFFSVCINPHFLPLAKTFLAKSKIKICTVIGFPLGANLSRVKAYEAREAVKEGADEIDMVINISALKDKDYKKVEQDILGVVKSAKGLICKVILETALLNNQEKEIGCQIAVEAGAHFVKTSTGFQKSGATVGDVQLMRRIVGNRIGVKAAGGISNYETALKLVEAGATRIGASKGVEIVKGSHF
ncbi:MAG: deoxyribose-phosphate aldolase [Elusimicrobiota bacterium]